MFYFVNAEGYLIGVWIGLVVLAIFCTCMAVKTAKKQKAMREAIGKFEAMAEGKTYDEVRVVNDQIGTPTYCFDLSRLLVDMCETEKYGYYHATNEGDYISWYDFTCEIYKQAGMDTKVIPVSTEEYGLSVAARPSNSRLDRSKLLREGFEPLPLWQDAVARYLKEADL